MGSGFQLAQKVDPLFAAPEVLNKQEYDVSADMWSIGIIMYLLLSGDHPFLPARSFSELSQNITNYPCEFPKESWSHVSDQAKTLIRSFLIVSPNARSSARKSLIDKWLNIEEDELINHDLTHVIEKLKLWNAKQREREEIFNDCWTTVKEIDQNT